MAVSHLRNRTCAQSCAQAERPNCSHALWLGQLERGPVAPGRRLGFHYRYDCGTALGGDDERNHQANAELIYCCCKS